MKIIEATETAILEAVVTAAADSAARALEIADAQLAREARRINKVVATPQYKIVDVTELPGGHEFTFHYGEFEV